MFAVNDTVVYKGHGLTKVAGISRKRGESGKDAGDAVEAFYLLKSARTQLVTTKLLVRVEGAETTLRLPVSEAEAKAIIKLMDEEAQELPDDPLERARILDDIVGKNDYREMAALVRDYRQTKLLNLERVEIKRIKAVARDLAEEVCFVLKLNRIGLKGKFSIRSA